MNQRAIFINGLVVLCVLIFAGRMWLINAPETKNGDASSIVQTDKNLAAARTIEMPANQRGWMAIGKGPMSIRSTGTVDLGGLKTVPNDVRKPGDAKALVPRLPYGTLVGKVGESGEPFKIGIIAKIAGKDTVFVAINDDDYSDNSGFYTVMIDAYEAIAPK